MPDSTRQIIDGRIFRTYFACDLETCKGACCTFPGGTGAPVRDDEIEQIEKAYPAVERYLPREHRKIIEKRGLFERNTRGNFIRCYQDRACVLVRYENGIAGCALQYGFLRDRTSFPKPISCHLFPIRVDGNGNGMLRYEEFSECRSALRRGEEEEIPLVDFLREAIVREYGETFHRHLQASSRMQMNRSDRIPAAE